MAEIDEEDDGDEEDVESEQNVADAGGQSDEEMIGDAGILARVCVCVCS